jgi:type I restriction enzyme S subunit
MEGVMEKIKIDKRKLPQGWKRVKLGDVCDVINGKNQSDVIDSNGKYPIYGSSGIFGFANKYLCNEGTTVIGRKGTINSPIYVSTKFWNVDTAFGLSPKDTLNGKFLYYFCRGFNFHALDKSTTIPSLAKRDLLIIDFVLPPLREQHAIVSKIEELLSELDKGKQQLETALRQLKVYRQAVLKWAFEGKLTNKDVREGELPQLWKLTPLKELIDKISDGPFGSHLKSMDYVDEGIRVIRLENIGEMEFRDEYKTFVTREKYETIKSHTVTHGDIIFSSFISDNIRSVILPSHIENAINKADCFLVRVSDSKILRKYLAFYFSSRAMRNQLINHIHGATRPRINTTQLKIAIIPVPPLKEQLSVVQEIESRLSVCDKVEETINQCLAQAETLRQSILKKAFEGTLN